MGRNRQGWTIRRRVQGGVFYARYTIEGRTKERSTGHRDSEPAKAEAARMYARDVGAERPAPTRVRAGASRPLEELVAEWLVSLENTHEPGTLKTWELYAGTHWIPWFRAAHNIVTSDIEKHFAARLGKVLRATVLKERTAFRSFVTWCKKEGHVSLHTELPPLPKKARGTRYEKRRRVAAPEVSPEQVRRFLRALPEWSDRRHPTDDGRMERFAVRARFILAYETTLRPSTLDRLSVPEHYKRGGQALWITLDIDKEAWERSVPLTYEARKALMLVCPAAGLIFGKHDYRDHVRKAADKAFPPEVARRFTTAHLRSAGITHLLEQPGANLLGAQHMAGQKQLSTTTRYSRPSERAALDALGSRLGGPQKKRGAG